MFVDITITANAAFASLTKALIEGTLDTATIENARSAVVNQVRLTESQMWSQRQQPLASTADLPPTIDIIGPETERPRPKPPIRKPKVQQSPETMARAKEVVKALGRAVNPNSVPLNS